MSIVTKTGDGGETTLASGIRVKKTDLRVQVVGLLDDLMTHLGVAKVYSGNDIITGVINHLQEELLKIMPLMSTHQVLPSGIINDAIEFIESQVDFFNKEFTGFVIPGAKVQEAYLQVCRTKARLCELEVWRFIEEYPGLFQAKRVAVFLNRLSDLLFLMALK